MAKKSNASIVIDRRPQNFSEWIYRSFPFSAILLSVGGYIGLVLALRLLILLLGLFV